MDYSCPSCGANLKYKSLRIARKKNAVFVGRYGCRLCPECGAKIEYVRNNPSDKHMGLLPILIPLVMGAYIFDSMVLRFFSGGLAVIFIAFMVYLVIKKKGTHERLYKLSE